MNVTNASNTPATQPDSKTAQAQTGLSSNFDTFLTLLTTQLQNQDPMNPMDSSQFTQQLVSYSQVEQAIETNQNLSSLVSATQSSDFSNLVNYIGKDVTLDSNVAGLQNGQAQWNYSLDADADAVAVTVKNDKGDVVYKGTGELGKGDHAFTWDGRDNNGNLQPDGAYSVDINSTTIDGSNIGTDISVSGRVQSVQTDAGVNSLVVNGASVPLGTLTKVSEHAAENA